MSWPTNLLHDALSFLLIPGFGLHWHDLVPGEVVPTEECQDTIDVIYLLHEQRTTMLLAGVFGRHKYVGLAIGRFSD